VFETVSARLVRVLLAAAALLTFSLSFLVVADVIGRVVFSRPVKGTPEMVSMSIVIICFLLAGYAVQSGGMLRTDVLEMFLGQRARTFANLASCVLGAGFFALIVWGTVEPLQHAWSTGEFEGEGALRVPVWPARIVVLFGATLVTVIYLGRLVETILALRGGRSDPD
jgi:TRAP-type C4-dicarboxylate transport system permease small subunit